MSLLNYLSRKCGNNLPDPRGTLSNSVPSRAIAIGPIMTWKQKWKGSGRQTRNVVLTKGTKLAVSSHACVNDPLN